MNSSTTAPVGLAEEMAQLFSKHLTAYIADNPEATIGDVTTMMRQELQTVGRRSLETALTVSDNRQPTVPCHCGEAAPYLFRRQAQLITVFGKVSYRRSYHVCRCGQGLPARPTVEVGTGAGQSWFGSFVSLIGSTNLL